MKNDVWARGLCTREDCAECNGSRRGCTWNPYACTAVREERAAEAQAKAVGYVSPEALALAQAVAVRSTRH